MFPIACQVFDVGRVSSVWYSFVVFAVCPTPIGMISLVYDLGQNKVGRNLEEASCADRQSDGARSSH